MSPEDVSNELVEKAARAMPDAYGEWNARFMAGETIEPAYKFAARHALAAVIPEIQAQALRDLDREYDRLAARPDLSAITVRREALLDGFELAMLFLEERAARLTEGNQS